MNRKKSISIVLLLVMLFSEFAGFSLQISEAAVPKEEKLYKEAKAMIEKMSGEKVETPFPNFYITADGKEIARNVSSTKVLYDQMEDPYVDKKIPVAATVKVGTKLDAISFSKPGMPGAKVNKYDWQLAYWNLEEKAYDKAYIVDITERANFTQVADKPGFMIFYLNVSDDYIFKNKDTGKPISHTNWSDQGERKVDGAYRDGLHYRVKDWYYTPIKIKVVNGEDNIIMKELTVTDSKKNEVMNSFTREMNPEDPFNPEKHIEKRLKEDKTVALKQGSSYRIRSKYQFVSFTEGKFDITNPSSMNDKQRAITTEINKNEILAKIAVDNKLRSEDIKLSTDKPTVTLKNLEEAVFEWEYIVPNDIQKEIKFKNVVTNTFDPVNMVKEDDAAELTFIVKSNDLAAKAPVLLLNKGKETTELKVGETQSALVSFTYLLGEDIIGLDPNTNPKLTVDLTVKDKNGKILVEDTVRTEKLLKPKETITFKTKEFTPTTDEITVCGKVNKIHKEKGYNHDTSNDKICRTFKLGAPDIGMKAPVKLKLEGKPINNVQIGGIHHAEFILKHYSGTEIVGTGEGNNKRVRVNVTISDGNRVIMRETVVVDRPLKPGDEVPIKPKGGFTSQTGKIIACAEVDEAHAKLGFNIANANDKICQAFSTVKNYHATDVKLSPSNINLSEKEKLRSTQVTINYTLGHEEATVPGDNSLNPNPIVEIKHNGRLIARKNVKIGRNSTVRDYHTANINLSEGANVFTVEVNPGPSRAELEFKPGMKNPYVDNIATGNLNVTRNNKCIECNWKHTDNQWTETFRWVEYICSMVSYTKKDGSTGSRCECDRDSWSEDHEFWEQFTIDQMDFRSKWSKDTKSGWDNVTNYGSSKIKSGYGFELRVFTRYRTNRNILPKPDPYDYGPGCADSLTRSPGASVVDNNENVFVELPYKDNSGKKVCVLLDRVGRSGPWYNRVNEFQFKNRVTPSGRTERKMFINEGTGPGFNKVEVRTSRVDGYHPDRLNRELTKVKERMQDCDGFFIQVLPQDDIKTHVIQ